MTPPKPIEQEQVEQEQVEQEQVEQEQFYGPAPISGWRRRLHVVIFGSETFAGRAFDVVLIGAISLSVLSVMLESIEGIGQRYGRELYAIEWSFTLLFTAEYLLRLACVGRPRSYATSFFGVVDLLAIVPTYLSVLLPGAQYLLAIRLVRILRIFRVLKLVQYVAEAQVLMRALRQSRRKIELFVFTVLTLVIVLGSLMYLIEGRENGFTSIPRSVYWAIVTLTTVGYGDISPQTPVGQALASFMMVLGYGMIAVPTGIVGVELARTRPSERSFGPPGARREPVCEACASTEHDDDARCCKLCGGVVQRSS